jgi:hypothetical protein
MLVSRCRKAVGWQLLAHHQEPGLSLGLHISGVLCSSTPYRRCIQFFNAWPPALGQPEFSFMNRHRASDCYVDSPAWHYASYGITFQSLPLKILSKPRGTIRV